ncbi:MAG: proline--tRNA ligase [Clostridiales bacterium]|nr:proline--tRNA ligase [Clostridiales bacterium]
MRASRLFVSTMREVPAEAEIISHKLMLRAGMIHKEAAGIYTYLPLAWRSMKKIMQIIREEMDAAGGQELFMSTAHPAEIWQQSGRWQVYGAELWRLQDRHGRDFCLAPTHEEMITLNVKNIARSYRQLPQLLYQIQTKFRDERRPRFGLMRGREFIMKDLYSFDRDEAGLDASYQAMYQAYSNIFHRCGLRFRPVEADSGAIGGKGSHEFMALAESGEAEILYCTSCDYAASSEIAATPPQGTGSGEELKEVEDVYTPDCITVEDVANFLGVTPDRVVKTMCYQADDRLVLVLIRGDRQINEIKLKNILDCFELQFAPDEAIRAAGLVPGYLGPVGVKEIKIIADSEVPLMVNHECGGGRESHHFLNINPGRDYQIDLVDDIRLVRDGEPCPHCGKALAMARGIEVGQVFKLHTKYSKVLGARYADENGQEKDMVMGCYGIGVGRTMAAVIEQNHDDGGIIWPMAVAPYQVIVIPVNDRDSELMALAEKLYQELLRQKIEAVLDDRPERPGVKFNDADLLGYPFRVTIGKKAKEEQLLELKERATGEVRFLPFTETVEFLKQVTGNK